MDLAPAIGIGGGFAVVIAANVMEGGNPMSLVLLPPMMLVFGTTVLITMAGGTMDDAKKAVGSLKRAFTGGVPPSADLVPTVVSLAERARREGLLALEDAVKDVEDPFLTRGINLAIDGTDPDEVREIMESEVYTKRAADKQAAKFFADAGAYAPTVGIIGTVMGLVHVLENLAKPEELGHLIAAAFVATLWGVTSANVIFLPLGNRLKRLGEIEVARMEIIIEGVAAIQAGSNPRVVAQKLRSLMASDDKQRQPDVRPETRRSRGGAREPRALAGDVRRHGHPADGAVHRDVRDERGRPEEVQRPQDGPGGRLRPVHLDPGRLRQHPRPARAGDRRPGRSEHDHQAPPGRADQGRTPQWPRASARARRVGAQPRPRRWTGSRRSGRRSAWRLPRRGSPPT